MTGWQSFSFAWPWLAALLLLPLLVRLLAPRRAVPETGADNVLRFPYLSRLQAHFTIASGPPARRWRIVPLALAYLGVTLALMQPQSITHQTVIHSEGHDLMLAVDLSGSMQALDFTTHGRRISRHQVIQQVVSDFVTHRQGDRIGLVLFGSNAYLQVPLTFDLESVRKLIDNTRVGEAGDATAIGDALGLALQNLRDRPEQSRAIVLLTDGGDNASTVPPLEAARLAAQYGIRVFTIGVGSDGPVPIPDQNGHIVMAAMDLDEGLLRQIATMTGGAYYRASDTEALQAAYRAIDRLEKSQTDRQGFEIRTPLFRYPLGFALAMIVLAVAVPALAATGKGRRHV